MCANYVYSLLTNFWDMVPFLIGISLFLIFPVIFCWEDVSKLFKIIIFNWIILLIIGCLFIPKSLIYCPDHPYYISGFEMSISRK